MSIWELRHWIESRTPWWLIPVIVFGAAIISSFIGFYSYGKKDSP